MGKDCGSWQQHYPWQSPNPNRVSIPPDLGEQNIAHSMAYPLYANHCPVSPSGAAAGFVVPQNPELKSFCGNKLQAWYSYNPQQTLSPTPESITGEKFYVSRCGEVATNQKRFLVFDQSGNRTSLVFSSVGYPFQHPFSSTLKHSEALNKDTPILDSVKKQDYPWLDEKQHETHVSDGGSGSEMHEDTEELDALLYSDDDEETSTGHSPSEMTGHENNEANDDRTEVGSSVTPIKRRRFEHDQALMDTASSRKHLDLEDDAQSSCIRGDPSEGSFSSKRSRRERIRETVGILRSIIPGGKGNKDPIVLLDEAIGYLNSMRMKAKALGATAAAI
eukprot:TRINITY_DN2930_c0_g1_i1.p1 TRINITY_DN2930_c0_g1~~TRINITY_DN2930_c0_g1_i1.p1  ORF type:complete len:333 (+),score=81.00 TRINITY_DN2930_c0_g1_i1:936-1934(+)